MQLSHLQGKMQTPLNNLTSPKKQNKIMNLIEGLLYEMNCIREEIAVYESLPGGVGFLSSGFMRMDIQNAERAMSNGDTVEMMACYTKLKETCPED